MASQGSEDTWGSDASERAAELRDKVERRESPYRRTHHRDENGQMATGVYNAEHVISETTDTVPPPPHEFKVGDRVTVNAKGWEGYTYCVQKFIGPSPRRKAVLSDLATPGVTDQVAVTKLVYMPEDEEPQPLVAALSAMTISPAPAPTTVRTIAPQPAAQVRVPYHTIRYVVPRCPRSHTRPLTH